MELKDGFSGVNLQFSKYCQVLLLSASTWQRTGFNPKSKGKVLWGLNFPCSLKHFIVCHPSMPSVQGPSPDTEQPVALQDWAQLGALGGKLSSHPASRNAVLPVGDYLHFSDEDDSNSTSCDYCWENIIWRTEWATSTPIPSHCACFRVPLAVCEGKSAVACCRSSSLALCVCGFLKSPGRFHHHGQDLGWGWLGKD